MSNHVINISLSAHTILYFPFYLLSQNPDKYGFENTTINLINMQGDKEALDALENNCQYAVCDPMVAKTNVKNYSDIYKIEVKMLKPIILKTGLWGISNDKTLLSNGKNSNLLNKMDICEVKPFFSNVYTYSDSTSASKVMQFLAKNKNLKNIPDSKIKAKQFGDEFTVFLNEDEKIDMVVTCDILAIKILENNRNNDIYTILDFADVEHDGFKALKKNVFTALLTNKYKLEHKDTKLIVKAIDLILEEFYTSENLDLISKRILSYHERENIFLTNLETRKLLFFENRNDERKKIHEKDITDALEELRIKKYYPEGEKVKNLRTYWKNSCKIWDNEYDGEKIFFLSFLKKWRVQNCFYRVLWEKKGIIRRLRDVKFSITNNPILSIFYAIVLGLLLVYIKGIV